MIEQVLDFWFGQPESENYGKARTEWFTKNVEFDQQVKEQFLTLYQQAAAQELETFLETPQGCLALIILLDQFPRNMFRGQPQAFATDHLALKYANYAVTKGYDQELLPVQRWFIYLPFEHSENLADQKRSLELMSSLKDDPETIRIKVIEYAQRHFDVIQRFGRFPHRNQILGRISTPEEQEFLTQPGSSF